MSKPKDPFTKERATRALSAAIKAAPGPWRLRVLPNGEIIVEPTRVAEPGQGSELPTNDIAHAREIVL